MLALHVEISRFVDAHQPGWVECRLVDAADNVHIFIEKAPVVSAAHLDATTHYPQPGLIACTLVERRSPTTVVVDTLTPWGISSLDDVSRFTVRTAQTIELTRNDA
jgi:hypothetical protein